MKIKQSNGEAGGAWIIFITLTLSIVLTHRVVYFRERDDEDCEGPGDTGATQPAHQTRARAADRDAAKVQGLVLRSSKYLQKNSTETESSPG